MVNCFAELLDCDILVSDVHYALGFRLSTCIVWTLDHAVFFHIKTTLVNYSLHISAHIVTVIVCIFQSILLIGTVALFTFYYFADKRRLSVVKIISVCLNGEMSSYFYTLIHALRISPPLNWLSKIIVRYLHFLNLAVTLTHSKG